MILPNAGSNNACDRSLAALLARSRRVLVALVATLSFFLLRIVTP
jgi:hypothetical protein